MLYYTELYLIHAFIYKFKLLFFIFFIYFKVADCIILWLSESALFCLLHRFLFHLWTVFMGSPNWVEMKLSPSWKDYLLFLPLHDLWPHFVVLSFVLYVQHLSLQSNWNLCFPSNFCKVFYYNELFVPYQVTVVCGLLGITPFHLPFSLVNY